MPKKHLYRAKRLDWQCYPEEKQWVEGDLIHCPYGTVIQYSEDEVYDKGNCSKASRKQEKTHKKYINVVVDSKTVCEYTGLRDKNNKKIFEKDIVSCHKKRGAAFWSCVVVWNEVKARFDVMTMDCSFPMCTDDFDSGICIEGIDYEIIGNIFDNPELCQQPQCEINV